MGRKYAIRSQDEFYFVTFTVVNWIDVFIRPEYNSIFIESIKYCQREKGLLVGGWCIMTSHVHLALGTSGKNRLEDIIRDLKSFTSRHIRKHMEHSPYESRKEWMLSLMKKAGESRSNNNDFQFWQQHNHPIELSTPEIIHQRLEYIHDNPVKAGFVENPADWSLSSARDYEDQNGLIDIEFLYSLRFQ